MKLPRTISYTFFAPFTIQIILAYEWFLAGWEKIHGGQFAPNIGKTLDHFENGNPHEWYITFVLAIAKSHPVAFGLLVQWGELFVGIGLVATIALFTLSQHRYAKPIARFLAVTALSGGALMNLNFYLAAGWTSPSTAALNVLMFWVQVVLLVVWAAVICRDKKGLRS